MPKDDKITFELCTKAILKASYRVGYGCYCCQQITIRTQKLVNEIDRLELKLNTIQNTATR